jgi:hypothetical protein
VYERFIARRTVRFTDLKTPNGQEFPEKRVFGKLKNAFLDVFVVKPADFKSPPIVHQLTCQRLRAFRTIGTHAKTPTKEAKVEAADLSQLTIQDRMVAPCAWLGWCSSSSSRRPKAKLGGASGAAAEARVAGSGYKATAAALGPAMRALSTSSGLGFAHFGALAGVGKGQRVSTACKCFTKSRLWLMLAPGGRGCAKNPAKVFARGLVLKTF